LFSIPNDEQPIAALIQRLARYRLERIVIEATGRLEHAFVSAAIAKRLPVVVVAPLKVRRFAQAAGQLAKTDAIDARLIARFAAALKPATRPPIDANSQIIKDLVVRRGQLTSLRTTEKNRRSVMPEALTPSIDRIIESLDREIASLEQLIQNAVEQHVTWRHKRDLLTSMRWYYHYEPKWTDRLRINAWRRQERVDPGGAGCETGRARPHRSCRGQHPCPSGFRRPALRAAPARRAYASALDGRRLASRRSGRLRAAPGCADRYLIRDAQRVIESIEAAARTKDLRASRVQKNACSPVCARPRISACTSCVPS